MALPQIKSRQTFRSSDNQNHDTRREATVHELGIHLMNKIQEETGFRNDGQLKAVCLHLSKGFLEKGYREMFQDIGTAHRLKS